jgi:steroid delta-isomerase-like uncharacterized protein
MSATQIVKSYYEAFNAKKFDEMLNFLTDDVVHDINQAGRTVGKEAFKKFLSEMDEYYDEHLNDIVIMVSTTGERAAAEFICHGVYKNPAEGLPPARGQKYQLPVGCFFEISENKILRISNFYNMNDWLLQVK